MKTCAQNYPPAPNIGAKRKKLAIYCSATCIADSLRLRRRPPALCRPGPPSMCPGGVCTRHTIDVNISKYDLASSYLPAFKRSVVEGDIQAVMCSYNSINGCVHTSALSRTSAFPYNMRISIFASSHHQIDLAPASPTASLSPRPPPPACCRVPSCANKWLLGDVLRKDWNFKGMVTGDSGAVQDIYSSHKYAPTMSKAVIEAISAGTDVQSAGWKRNQPWASVSLYPFRPFHLCVLGHAKAKGGVCC